MLHMQVSRQLPLNTRKLKKTFTWGAATMWKTPTLEENLLEFKCEG